MLNFWNPAGMGLDLAAQVLQQGRDHGISSYNKWREFCGLNKVRTFSELIDVMSNENIKSIESVYK